MSLVAYLSGPGRKGRSSTRHRAATTAGLKAFRGPAERVRVVNISTDGCGFEARWPFQTNMMVLLKLPGLETWPATVIWYEQGRGGLRFVRKLHPKVARRFESAI